MKRAKGCQGSTVGEKRPESESPELGGQCTRHSNCTHKEIKVVKNTPCLGRLAPQKSIWMLVFVIAARINLWYHSTMKQALQFLVVLTASGTVAMTATTNRVFYIGNSLTDGTLTKSKITLFAQQRGNGHTPGQHLNWNSSLEEIWTFATPVGATTPAYGPYTNALPNFTWDAMTLQPFFRPTQTTGTIAFLSNDMHYCRQFIDYAQVRSTNVRAFIYGHHPKMQRFSGLPQGYADYWLKPYSATNPTLTESRAYFDALVTSVLDHVSTPVYYIPVGETMYEMDQHIKASGNYCGLTNITQLYADDVHCNSTGTYVSACAFYAVIYRENPIGLPPISIDTNLAAAIQTTTWQVVSTYPHTGVPEPCGLLVLALLRRRACRAAVISAQGCGAAKELRVG